ncbi:hypothetical protein G7Y79_00020g049310 [Physcia stellaris]|nr:hypothetical protein G7Y79_00020g049310 [Physcia stellaris]
MELISYANEFAFLHDDVTDNASKERLNFINIWEKSNAGELVLELMSIDRERAKVLVKSWEQLVNAGASGSKDREFLNLEDYVPWRIVDVGEPYVFSSIPSIKAHVDGTVRFWFGIITYGMAFTISENERKSIMSVTAPASVSLAFTNDLFSWQKEYDQFRRDSKAKYMVNAVWILMQEHSITMDKAQKMLRIKIAELNQEYQRVKAEFQNSRIVSTDCYLWKFKEGGRCTAKWVPLAEKIKLTGIATTSNAISMEASKTKVDSCHLPFRAFVETGRKIMLKNSHLFHLPRSTLAKCTW